MNRAEAMRLLKDACNSAVDNGWKIVSLDWGYRKSGTCCPLTALAIKEFGNKAWKDDSPDLDAIESNAQEKIPGIVVGAFLAGFDGDSQVFTRALFDEGSFLLGKELKEHISNLSVIND